MSTRRSVEEAHTADLACGAQGPRDRSGSARAAIDRALIDLCLERGYENLTLGGLCARLAIDRSVFRRHYADLEDCFCSNLERMGEEFLAFVGEAVLTEGEWRGQMRAASAAMMTFFLADRPRARFMLIDTFGAGTRAQLIRDNSMSAMIELIDRGRAEPGAPGSLSRNTAEGIAGTVYDAMRNLAARDVGLAGWRRAIPELLYAVVLPYLGPEVAAEELAFEPQLVEAP